jgi:hypothetical protein
MLDASYRRVPRPGRGSDGGKDCRSMQVLYRVINHGIEQKNIPSCSNVAKVKITIHDLNLLCNYKALVGEGVRRRSRFVQGR